jgi:hypothetical protein
MKTTKIEASYNPKVSLDPQVHYTTQQGKYDILSTGVGELLSDSRIHYYALQGRYGSARQAAAQAIESQRLGERKAREAASLRREKKRAANEELINALLSELL